VFALVPAGLITGHVRDQEGAPLSRITFNAFRANYNALGGWTKSLAASVATDDRGEYRLFGLAPGRYYIETTYRPGANERSGRRSFIQSSSHRSADFVYPLEFFYPGTITSASATAVVVNRSRETFNINFVLAAIQTFHVRGRIETGTPSDSSEKIDVVLRPRDDAVSAPSILHFHATVDRGGTFDLRWIPPSEYYLWAIQHSPKDNYSARTTVTVVQADVQGLSLTLQPGIDLKVRMTIQDGTIASVGERGCFELHPKPNGKLGGFIAGIPTKMLACPRLTATNSWPKGYCSIEANDDGTFVFRDVRTGSYHLDVGNALGDVYLKSARLGSQEVLTAPIEIPAKGITDSLEVTLGTAGATTDGRAAMKENSDVASVKVVLVPELALRGVKEFYRWADVNASGRFRIRGVRPGSYKLFAWEAFSTYEWLDPALLKADEDHGIAVELKENETKVMVLPEVLLRR
jgi:Polysaccharide lyase family 4, domain II